MGFLRPQSLSLISQVCCLYPLKISAVMDQPESLCFYASGDAHKRGDISEKTKLQHLLAHVFSGVRHPDEVPIQASEVERWANQDIISAAVLNCMV